MDESPKLKPKATPEQRRLSDAETAIEQLRAQVKHLEREIDRRVDLLAKDTMVALRNLETKALAEFRKHGLR